MTDDSDQHLVDLRDLYGEWDAKSLASDDAQWARNGKFMKLEPGENVVRFLPPPRGAQSPFVFCHEHRKTIPGTDKQIVWACARIHAKSKCNECDEASELIKSSNLVDNRAGTELLPRPRALAAVIDRNTEGAGCQILASGKMLYKQLRRCRENMRMGGNFSDPFKGFDVIILREGTGREDTEYQVNCARESTPLGTPEQMREWLMGRPDLQRFIRCMSPEQIAERAAEMQRGLGRGGGGATGSARLSPPAVAESPKAARSAQEEVSKVDDGNDIPF